MNTRKNYKRNIKKNIILFKLTQIISRFDKLDNKY